MSANMSHTHDQLAPYMGQVGKKILFAKLSMFRNLSTVIGSLNLKYIAKCIVNYAGEFQKYNYYIHDFSCKT